MKSLSGMVTEVGDALDYKSIMNRSFKASGQAGSIADADLDALRACLLEMTVDLDERCRSYGISLFLVGGSLLGAVRHGGFIPWDDDMDLGLVRRDYERLKEVFEEGFSDAYEMRCPRSPWPNGNRFMQIYKRGTVLRTANGGSPLQPEEVYIDVFPYDHAPDGRLRNLLRGLRANAAMLVASCVMDAKYPAPNVREVFQSAGVASRTYLIARRAIGGAFSFRSPEEWFDTVDRIVADEGPSARLTSATGRRHYFGETFPAEVFLPLRELDFDGHALYAPQDPDAYLRANYGDGYMKPPAEADRESHGIVALDLREG